MSFPAYPSYLDSGDEWLGNVPAHWEVTRLKQACEVFPSNVDKKTVEGQQGVRLCNYTDVYYNDEIRGGMPFMEASATEDQIERFELRAGDTIFTKDSETPDDIARSAFVPADLPGVICGYHLSMARPQAGTCGAFIKRYFDASTTRAYFHVKANGLTRVGLGQYAVDNAPIALPPLLEQTTIAAFLDSETAKIDSLVEEQRRLIELLKEKRQAAIAHAVTKGLDPTVPMKDSGVEWLGEVPTHWGVTQARRLIRSIEQGWSPECENWPAGAEEWGVLKTGCVNGGVFRPDENKALPERLDPIPEYEVRPGDILMSRANGSPELVGSISWVGETPPRLMLSDKIFRIKVSKGVDPQWFALLFNSNPLRAQIIQAISGAGGLANNLPQSELKEMMCPLPPKDEQLRVVQEITRELAWIDQMADQAVIVTRFLGERRAALISAAVTGKIDVRNTISRAEAA